MNESLQAADREEIERRAYFFWQQRGCPEGSPEIDWLLAERETANQTASSEVDLDREWLTRRSYETTEG